MAENTTLFPATVSIEIDQCTVDVLFENAKRVIKGSIRCLIVMHLLFRIKFESYLSQIRHFHKSTIENSNPYAIDWDFYDAFVFCVDML